jgi:integrase
VDRRTGKVKSTKSGETRRLPIEPRLRPLLQRLYARREGARVLWMPDDEDRAIMLRQHLQQAGVSRRELFDIDAHRKHITFHDLRATGITWCAVRGDDPLRIKQRAGHKELRDDGGLHPRGGEPGGRLRGAVPGPARKPHRRPRRGFGFGFGFWFGRALRAA